MSRPIRVEFGGAVYHVMARGNERQNVFLDDEDRQEWLSAVEEMSAAYRVMIHCYCLMGNHYRLVLETPLGNLSEAMGSLETTFTVRYNRRRKRSGHLFQGRFNAQLVEADGYAMELLRYVHLNPVRIGVEKGEAIPAEGKVELERWNWSSHRVYSGPKKGPSWLSTNWLGYFGANLREARRAYRKFVGLAFSEGIENPFDSVRGSLVLGGEALWERVGELMGGRDGDEERRWVRDEVDLESMRQRAERFADREEDVRVKAWLLVKMGRWKRLDAARRLGYRDGSALTHILKRVEAVRLEDQSLSRRMRELEDSFDSSFKP